MTTPEEPTRFRFKPIHLILVLALLTLALGLGSALYHTGGHKPNTGREAKHLERLREVGDAMRAYAAAHDGRYPEGTTSTEVFNALIAGGYLKDHRAALADGVASKNLLVMVSETGQGDVTDPETTRLTGEGVIWGVTAGIGPETPPGVPLVFSHGAIMVYEPGEVPRWKSNDPIYIYTHGGDWRIYRMGSQDSWEHPIMPEALPKDNSLRQVKPLAQ